MLKAGYRVRNRPLIILTLLAILLASPRTSTAGWIEEKPDRTIIHVGVFELPDASRREAPIRADAAVVAEFKKRFSAIFAEKYRDRYAADPERYGRRNWDNVEIALHQQAGIKIGNLGGQVYMGNLLAIAGGVAPDVMYVNFRQSGTFIHEGFLYPLDKPEDGYFADMTEKERDFRIHPKIRPVITRRGKDGKDHVWAIPYGGALGKVILYRRDLFDGAGIPYPHNNWTWDDFLVACRKISDPSKGVYGLRLGDGPHEAWYWITFLWSVGGEVLKYDPVTDTGLAAFDSREAAVALDFYTRLSTERWENSSGKHRGYAFRDPTYAVTKWERGEIGMMFTYIDERLFAQINPDVTGMVPVPVGPTGMRGGELNSRMMALFADIEDPAVRDAAWEYIRFFDCEDAARIKTRIMVEGGYGRFVNPRYLRMFGYEEVIRLAPKGWDECFEIAMRTGKPEPYARNCNTAYDIMTGPIRKARVMAEEGELPEDREARLDILQDLLRQAVRTGNEQLQGTVAPSEKTKRRITAFLALLCIAAACVFVFKRTAKTFTPPSDPGGQTVTWGFRKYAIGYFILLPAVLTVFFWQYVPLLWGSVMAFQDYKIMGDSTWVWLDNFGDILWDPAWWMAVWNSFRYSFLVIALTFLPPVVLAILLQEVPRGKIIFRTIYYLPAVISGLVTILLWKSFYEKSPNGLLNTIVMRIPSIVYIIAGLALMYVAFLFAKRFYQHGMKWMPAIFMAGGIGLCYTVIAFAWPILSNQDISVGRRLLTGFAEPRDWLHSSETAMFCCVLPMVWAGMGPGCLIYLAALKGIGNDMYEAADIDGATFIDKILFVVFPMLKALLIINFVGVFIGSWKATANILAMTAGEAATEVAGLHIFYKAFIYLKFGPATAMAWVLGFILVGFTVNQLQILSRMQFKAQGAKED